MNHRRNSVHFWKEREGNGMLRLKCTTVCTDPAYSRPKRTSFGRGREETCNLP